MSQVANFALFLGLWVLVVVGTFDGVRRWVLYRGRRALYQTVACAMGSLVMGSFHLWVHMKEENLIEGINKNPYAELPSGWGSDLTTEARAKASRSYASAAFMGHGVLLKHSNTQGQWVQFQPTEKDIADRERGIVARTQLEEQSLSFLDLALRWWVGVVLAAALGYLAGRTEKTHGG